MKKVIFTFFLIPIVQVFNPVFPLLRASTEICLFSIDSSSTKLTWTAFKTPKKIGVDGSFDKVQLMFSKENYADLDELLKGSTFEIDALTVNTKNPDRDKKIKKFFFEKMKNKDIKGKVISLEPASKVAMVELSMNGVTNKVPFNYEENGELLQLKAAIDVLTWKLDKSLNAIHEACKTLHMGKTWSDVNLKIEAKLVKTCK
jgi:polyisoprenoid-binding protein YceI